MGDQVVNRSKTWILRDLFRDFMRKKAEKQEKNKKNEKESKDSK